MRSAPIAGNPIVPKSLTEVNGWKCSWLLLLLEKRSAIFVLIMSLRLSSDNAHVPARLFICQFPFSTRSWYAPSGRQLSSNNGFRLIAVRTVFDGERVNLVQSVRKLQLNFVSDTEFDIFRGNRTEFAMPGSGNTCDTRLHVHISQRM